MKITVGLDSLIAPVFMMQNRGTSIRRDSGDEWREDTVLFTRGRGKVSLGDAEEVMLYTESEDK